MCLRHSTTGKLKTRKGVVQLPMYVLYGIPWKSQGILRPESGSNKSLYFFLLLLPQMSSEPDLSFYGVYDGHAGKDAAAFAASHVHANVLSSPHYPDDVVASIKDAFRRADQVFLDKGRKEVGIEVSRLRRAQFCPPSLSLLPPPVPVSNEIAEARLASKLSQITPSRLSLSPLASLIFHLYRRRKKGPSDFMTKP